MKLSLKIFLLIGVIILFLLLLLFTGYISSLNNLKTLPNKEPKKTILLDKKKEAIIKAIFTLQGCSYFTNYLEEDITIDRKGYDAYIEDHGDFYIYTFNWGNREKHLTVMKKNVTLD